MAYTAGDTILDDEYNTFVTGDAAGTGTHTVANVNSVWGSGSADKGYGQSSTISAVSAGTVITATQWNDFLGRIETLGSHQGTTVTDYSSLTTGDTIEAYGTVSTDLTNVYNNRFDCAAVGTAITHSSSRTAEWTTTVNTIVDLTFSSADTARYFFNAGGTVRLSFSRSGGTSSDKNSEWADLCTRSGTIWFSGSDSHTVNSQALTGTTKVGGNTGGSGSAVTDLTYHDLTGSWQEIFIQYADTAPYTANYIKVEAMVSGTQAVRFRVTFQDDAAETGNPTYPASGTDPASLDKVNGTLTVSASAVPPATTYITNTWGTPAWSTTDAL
jgi:hypothetical protein